MKAKILTDRTKKEFLELQGHVNRTLEHTLLYDWDLSISCDQKTNGFYLLKVALVSGTSWVYQLFDANEVRSKLLELLKEYEK